MSIAYLYKELTKDSDVFKGGGGGGREGGDSPRAALSGGRQKRGRGEEKGKGSWLVGFLTSSSTTRLYRGRAPRQSV